MMTSARQFDTSLVWHSITMDSNIRYVDVVNVLVKTVRINSHESGVTSATLSARWRGTCAPVLGCG